MREIDKLLHEIPLDELLGESAVETDERAISFEKTGGSSAARVRTHKTGTITAVAAALALAVGGGLYFGLSNNKLSPFSFLSKNGVSSPIGNQNRTLIEQFIEHRNGNPEVLGDCLVVFDEPIAPEHYLGEINGFEPDFQVLGYSYSGNLANIYICAEDLGVMEDNKGVDSIRNYNEVVADYENLINEAIVAGDEEKAEQLREELGKFVDDHNNGYYVWDEYQETERLFSDRSYVALKNTNGELLYNMNGFPAYDKIGDYDVGSMTIDMSRVKDKKVTFECTFAGKDVKNLEIPLNEYKMSAYNTIACDLEGRTVTDIMLKDTVTYTVKSISYDKGFVDVTVEFPKYSTDGEPGINAPYRIYSENGNMISTNTFITPVYENGTYPVKLQRVDIQNGLSDSNDTQTVTLSYSALDAPLEPERIAYFIVGSRRVYVNDEQKQKEGYGVLYCEPETGYDNSDNEVMYASKQKFFVDEIDEAKSLIEQIITQNERIDVSAYDVYLPQSNEIVIYGENGEVQYSSGTVNVFNEIDREKGDYTTAVKTLIINGEHYALSDDLLEQYKALCAKIAK